MCGSPQGAFLTRFGHTCFAGALPLGPKKSSMPSDTEAFGGAGAYNVNKSEGVQ